MSAIESVRLSLKAIDNSTDDECIKEMVAFCLDNIEGIRKEQDRDTRHKCAEAVSALWVDQCRRVDINRAHRACMNAKAVK